MKTTDGRILTPQGAKIVEAIQAGLAAMTKERWEEIRRAERENAEAGIDGGAHEWFAPEFEAARQATDGIQWDFTGWKDVLSWILRGEGKLGGVDTVVPEITYRIDTSIDGEPIIVAECGDASALYVIGEGYSSNPADTDDCPATDDGCWPEPSSELLQHFTVEEGTEDK